MNIGIIGLGYWGPNVARNFINHRSVGAVFGSDLDPRRLAAVKHQLPSIDTRRTTEEIINSEDIDAVAIAVPVSKHHEIARRALENGKHVLVEKPMTVSVKEAEELLSLASEYQRVLMVDQTFLYTGAVRKIKQFISSGELGDLLYFDSVRVNLGLFQHDSNVIWDLAPHDISILLHLVDRDPVAVSAVGFKHYQSFEDLAYITVFFEGSFSAHFHVNWLAPVKVRRILIGGTRKMILYDDTEASEKVKVYDKGVDVVSKEGIYETLIQYRTGDMSAPNIDSSEALAHVVNDFIRSIDAGERPLADGNHGLSVVRVLEAAQRSVEEAGKRIPIVV